MPPGDPVLIPPSVAVLRPSGRGPFRTIIMMHGCGGRQPFLFHYAEAFRNAGLAAVVVDSFAHRGIDHALGGESAPTICTPSLTGCANRIGATPIRSLRQVGAMEDGRSWTR